jgi:hypothetical protein
MSDKEEHKTALSAGIGLVLGVLIGSFTDNLGLWISLGLCFGAGIGSFFDNNK